MQATQTNKAINEHIYVYMSACIYLYIYICICMFVPICLLTSMYNTMRSVQQVLQAYGFTLRNGSVSRTCQDLGGFARVCGLQGSCRIAKGS